MLTSSTPLQQRFGFVDTRTEFGAIDNVSDECDVSAVHVCYVFCHAAAYHNQINSPTRMYLKSEACSTTLVWHQCKVEMSAKFSLWNFEEATDFRRIRAVVQLNACEPRTFSHAFSIHNLNISSFLFAYMKEFRLSYIIYQVLKFTEAVLIVLLNILAKKFRTAAKLKQKWISSMMKIQSVSLSSIQLCHELQTYHVRW